MSATINSRWIPRQQYLIELLEIYRKAPRPVLLKCSGGADRTSFASALFILCKVFEDNTNPDLNAAMKAARRQMRMFPYLHLPKKHQRWIRIFLDFYAEDHGNMAPLDWVRQRYQWERFAEYMLERGLSGYWAGPYLEKQKGGD